MKTTVKFSAALLALALTLLVGLGGTALLLAGLPALAAEQAAVGASVGSEVWTWGLAAAAASTALAALGAGFAVAKVGTAAIGALAEKPELFGRLLIFVGLAEGIAIYGLIVSILILNRLA
ncbi:MAG TPA: ATP synthase subunit C [Rubrivivax sp.]|nr:ATP synthase subunit C [Rubrivivax sp.]